MFTQSEQMTPGPEMSLRVAFSNTVLTFGLSADATLGEIARQLATPLCRRLGKPVMIAVIGVRISWLMLARKILLKWLASASRSWG